MHAVSINTLEAALDTDYRVAKSAYVDMIMFNNMTVGYFSTQARLALALLMGGVCVASDLASSFT